MRIHASRRLMLFCGLMAVVLLASTANGQPRSRRASSIPGGLAEGNLMKRHAKDLELSEEVIAKIDAAIDAAKAQEEELREQNKAAVAELNEILLQNLPSEKELMAASNKVAEIASKSRKIKMESVIPMRSLLTAEQLEKFMTYRKKTNRRR